MGAGPFWPRLFPVWGRTYKSETRCPVSAPGDFLQGSPVRSAARALGVPLASPLRLPQHADEHRPERPILLAVDEKLGEGFALRRP
jgi:hypothetical protein